MDGNVSIALIGPRGAGKSTVGRLLAEKLGLPLIETDLVVEAREGRTIARIFDESGEDAFRAAESAALAYALGTGPSVISTGGGIVSTPENRFLIRSRTFAVFLNAPPMALYRRISADPSSPSGRPPLTGLDPFQEMDVVVRMREPLYRECSSLALDTGDASPEEVCSLILDAYRKRIGSGD